MTMNAFRNFFLKYSLWREKRAKIVLLLLTFWPQLNAQELASKALYHKTCLPCHGAKGQGHIGKELSANLTVLGDEYLKEQFYAIMKGKRKTPGAYKMKQALEPYETQDLYQAMLYAQQLPLEISHQRLPAGSADRGRIIYQTCVHCHGAKAEGNSNPALPAPPLKGQLDRYLFQTLKDFMNGHRGDESPGAMQMKAMTATLTKDQDLYDVISYIKSFQAGNSKVIRDLTYKVYQGSIVDSAKLAQASLIESGDISDGRMDISLSKFPGNYTMIFEGVFKVEKDSMYNFKLSSSGQSKVYLDGKLILGNLNKGSEELHSLERLTQGSKAIRVEYVAAAKNNFFKLATSATGLSRQYLSVERFKKKYDDGPTVMLEPDGEQAIVFRNFLQGEGARSISVALPSGVNYVYDVANMYPSRMWTGTFLDVGPSRNFRGLWHNLLISDSQVQLTKGAPLSHLKHQLYPWPTKLNRDPSERNVGPNKFGGYKVDEYNIPTFVYHHKNIEVEDRLDALKNKRGLSRSLSFKSQENSDQLYFKVAQGRIKKITDKTDVYEIDNYYQLSVPGAILRRLAPEYVPYSNDEVSTASDLLSLADANEVRPKGRFLRVAIPGNHKTLTLAEVQIFSDDKNVALEGEASQVSLAHKGLAKYAIDGKINRRVTHTKEPGKDVWWEVDLKKMVAVDRIVIWNRPVLSHRLANFRVLLLDENRRVVWSKTVVDAPKPSVELIPELNDEMELLVPVKLKQGQGDFKIDYLFREGGE